VTAGSVVKRLGALLALGTFLTQGSAIAQPQPTPDAGRALEYYLNVDCFVGEKRKPLTELLQFKDAVEPTLQSILRSGPDQQTRSKFEKHLEREWERRDMFLKTNSRSGLTERQLGILRNVKKEDYFRTSLNNIVSRYRARAAFALAAIQSKTALTALDEVRRDDESMRSVIATALQVHRSKKKGD